MNSEFESNLAIVYQNSLSSKKWIDSKPQRSVSSLKLELCGVEYSFSNYLTASSLTEFNDGSDSILALSAVSSLHIYKIGPRQPYITENQSVRLNSNKGCWSNCSIDAHWRFNSLPNSAGKILTACSDGKLRFWVCNFKTQSDMTIENDTVNDATYVEYKAHTGKVAKAKILTNSNYCVSVGVDTKIICTDLESEKTTSVLNSHTSPLSNLEIHPYSPIVCVGEDTGYLVVWDLRMRRYICDFNSGNLNDPNRKIKSKHDSKVTSLRFDSTGCLLASGSENSFVKIWDLRKQAIIKTLPTQGGRIIELEFAKNSNVSLISASFNGNVLVWDWYNQTVQHKQNLQKDKLSVFKVDKENKKAFAGFLDKTLNIYEAETFERAFN